MFIAIVFNDLERTNIIGLIYFSKVKQIIKYSSNLIRYSDTQIKDREKKYKTFKNLFKIIQIPTHHAVKYFSNMFYYDNQQRISYLKKKKSAWKKHLKSR